MPPYAGMRYSPLHHSANTAQLRRLSSVQDSTCPAMLLQMIWPRPAATPASSPPSFYANKTRHNTRHTMLQQCSDAVTFPNNITKSHPVSLFVINRALIILRGQTCVYNTSQID